MSISFSNQLPSNHVLFQSLGGKDLVSKSQILAYYELVLKDFLDTGRVKVYFLCEYIGDNKFKSLLEEELIYEVFVRKKTVNATYRQGKYHPKYRWHFGQLPSAFNAI